ncbi:hypothetical protein MHU86_13040 [Fragilaria crotonensis]|nr:hypothetical protein MHU86_13040 [Fragilaria crotonensis]
MTSNVFPDFPHSIDSEPTENWSVEHVLQWHLLQSHALTDQKHAELVESLQRQFEERKQELWRIMESDENVPSVSSSNVMVAAPSKGAKAYNAAISKQPFATLNTTVIKKVQAIHIQVTTGPHTGMTVTVQPKANTACLVGRSAGKKFREKELVCPRIVRFQPPTESSKSYLAKPILRMSDRRMVLFARIERWLQMRHSCWKNLWN